MNLGRTPRLVDELVEREKGNEPHLSISCREGPTWFSYKIVVSSGRMRPPSPHHPRSSYCLPPHSTPLSFLFLFLFSPPLISYVPTTASPVHTANTPGLLAPYKATRAGGKCLDNGSGVSRQAKQDILGTSVVETKGLSMFWWRRCQMKGRDAMYDRFQALRCHAGAPVGGGTMHLGKHHA